MRNFECVQPHRSKSISYECSDEFQFLFVLRFFYSRSALNLCTMTFEKKILTGKIEINDDKRNLELDYIFNRINILNDDSWVLVLFSSFPLCVSVENWFYICLWNENSNWIWKGDWSMWIYGCSDKCIRDRKKKIVIKFNFSQCHQFIGWHSIFFSLSIVFNAFVEQDWCVGSTNKNQSCKWWWFFFPFFHYWSCG